MWVFALILAWPLLEIGLFVVVGGWLGLWATLAWVVLSAVLGVGLIRWQGMGALREVRGGAWLQALQPMAHGALIMLSGMLLILPGFFTDFLGCCCCCRSCGPALIAVLAARVQVHGFARGRAGRLGGCGIRGSGARARQDWRGDAALEVARGLRPAI